MTKTRSCSARTNVCAENTTAENETATLTASQSNPSASAGPIENEEMSRSMTEPAVTEEAPSASPTQTEPSTEETQNKATNMDHSESNASTSPTDKTTNPKDQAAGKPCAPTPSDYLAAPEHIVPTHTEQVRSILQTSSRQIQLEDLQIDELVYAKYEVENQPVYFLAKVIHIGEHRNNLDSKARIHFVAPPTSIPLANPSKYTDIGTNVDIFEVCYIYKKPPTPTTHPTKSTTPPEPVIIINTDETMERLSLLAENLQSNISRSKLDPVLVKQANILTMKKFLDAPRTATNWKSLAEKDKELLSELKDLQPSACEEVNYLHPDKPDIALNATQLKDLIPTLRSEISFFLKQYLREDPNLLKSVIGSTINSLSNKVDILSEKINESQVSKNQISKVPEVHIGPISGNKNRCALNTVGVFNQVNAELNKQLVQLPNPKRTEMEIRNTVDRIALNGGLYHSNIHTEAVQKAKDDISINPCTVTSTKFKESFGADIMHVLSRLEFPDTYLSNQERGYNMFGMTEFTLNQLYTNETTHILFADGFIADPNRETSAYSNLGGHWFDARMETDKTAKTKHNIAILSGQHYSYAYIIEDDMVRLTFTEEELPSIAKALKRRILRKGTKPTKPQSVPLSTPSSNNSPIDLTADSMNVPKSYAQAAKNLKWSQASSRRNRKPRVQFSGIFDVNPNTKKPKKNPGINNIFVKGLPNSIVITTDKLAKNVCNIMQNNAPYMLELVENAFQSRNGHFVILQAPSGQSRKLHKHLHKLRSISGHDKVHKFNSN